VDLSPVLAAGEGAVLATGLGAVLSVFILYLSALFIAWRIHRDRFKTHDANNLLGLLRMASYNGDEPKVEMAINMLVALWSPDDPAVVKLRRLVRSVASLLEVPTGCGFDLYLDSEISVRVVPKDAFSVLMNLMYNAARAACAFRPRQPVLVELNDHRLLIQNTANQDSVAALIEGPGTTTQGGNGHGYGRVAAAQSAASLGWKISVEPSGNFVITRVSGFVPVPDDQMEEM
jgi:hypothetical protein